MLVRFTTSLHYSVFTLTSCHKNGVKRREQITSTVRFNVFFPPVLLPFIPTGFSHFLPWYYMIYFVILLVHRDSRDMSECRRKYGSAWDEYCRTVRYRIIPRVYWGTQRQTLPSWGLFWPNIMAVKAHKNPNMNGLTDWFVFLEAFLKPRIFKKKKNLDSGLKVLQFFEFFDGRKKDSHYIYGLFEELPF